METQQMTLRQIEDYIFEKLPEVLEKDPRFVLMIEGIVAEKFPRRDEFARLLDEVHDLRNSTDRQFNEVRSDINELHSDMNRRFEQVNSDINELRSDMNRRFEHVDARFEQVDARFEQVDARFERVDARFEQIDRRFEQVDQRFEHADTRMDRMERELIRKMSEGFHNMQVLIDRLGSRWGIRNESIFRQTMKEVLEKSMGMTVKECVIAREQFDCIISNGQHILIEIAASAGQNILERLQRKRQLYIDETGITPHRFILVVGSIHSRRAEALRANGFEVIEPEE